MTSNNYHATPYDTSASGFYFHDYEDYEAKAKTHRNDYGDPVEEFDLCLERHNSNYVPFFIMSC